VHLVSTELLTAVQLAFAKGMYTAQHSRVSIYTHCKAFRQRRGFFKANIPDCLPCLVQLWNVFLLPSSAAYKNQHSVVASCTIVWKMPFTLMFWLCLAKYGTDAFFCDSLYKISVIQRQRCEITTKRVIWKKVYDSLFINCCVY